MADLSAELLGIPTLDPAWQATGLPPRWYKWGSIGRKRTIPGCGYHMYCADYKFLALWKHPETLVKSGCSCAVEVNYSTSHRTPLARALNWTYEKRLLAQFWGRRGVKLFVDLNVSPEFARYNLLGVPRGWAAYATRHHCGQSPLELDVQHSLACHHADGDSPLFVVFGGGKTVRDYCSSRRWAWWPEDAHLARRIARPPLSILTPGAPD